MKIIHSMIRVRDLERSLAFYRDAMGFSIAARMAFDGFTLVYLRAAEGEFELELTHNHGGGEPYELGNGYGHLAVCVDDLDAEHRRLREQGAAPAEIKEFCRAGELLARFFFVQDPDGYKIEVLQRHGRYR